VHALGDDQAALLEHVQQVGDYDHADEMTVDLAGDLWEAGLLTYVHGPVTRMLDERDGWDDEFFGIPVDPVVTARGQLALLCRRLAEELA
jgi:hypothetical protein